ncbi:MAG: hypothetical protein AAFU41_16180 [Pseudomonadota bacterium]
MAIQIIRHAFSMIFGNFGQALRVSVGPFLILAGVFVVAGQFLRSVPSGGPGLAMMWLLLGTGALIVFSWIAVAWHRFILLEEYSGLLPRFEMPAIGPYVQTTFLLFLVLLVCMLPLIFIGAPLAQVLGGGGTSIIGFVVGILTLYLLFRFGMTLPGTAIGKPITFRESWAATKKESPTLWGVAAILTVMNIVIEMWSSIPLAPTLGNQIFQLVFAVGLNWLTMMLSVCVLTTFYGHLIEKRPLID